MLCHVNWGGQIGPLSMVVFDNTGGGVSNSDMGPMWMVRAGVRGKYIDIFRDSKIVGMGWDDIGDLSRLEPADIRSRVEAAHYNKNGGWITKRANQLGRFRFEVSIGDYVLSTYGSGSAQKYLLGLVRSGYEYTDDFGGIFYHLRHVSWESGEIFREDLGEYTRKTLGYRDTIFSILDEQKVEIVRATRHQVGI